MAMDRIKGGIVEQGNTIHSAPSASLPLKNNIYGDGMRHDKFISRSRYSSSSYPMRRLQCDRHGGYDLAHYYLPEEEESAQLAILVS